jgi:hypothetical protein
VVDPIRLSIDPLTVDPFEIETLRAHCHVDEQPGTLSDAMLLLYAKSAVLWAEGEMHRTIYSRSHRWVLRCFPYDAGVQEIRLPRGKTQSVESIQYSTAGQIVTLTGPSASPPGSGFQEDLNGDDGGVIMPVYNGSWQGTDLNVPAPVAINFTAGWAADSVPEDIQQALLFYVSDAYEQRGTEDVERGRYLDIRTSKLSSYVLHRTYGISEIWPAGPRW